MITHFSAKTGQRRAPKPQKSREARKRSKKARQTGEEQAKLSSFRHYEAGAGTRTKAHCKDNERNNDDDNIQIPKGMAKGKGKR